MKTPEEYCEEYYGSEELLIPLIKQIQTEAWNEAIDEACKIPSLYIHDWNFTPADIEKSILKLKK